MLPPEQRAVIVTKDFYEQVGDTPPQYVLILGGDIFIALTDFMITDQTVQGSVVGGGTVAFHVSRHWTIFPYSLVTLQTFQAYSEDAKATLKVTRELLKSQDVEEEGGVERLLGRGGSGQYL